MTFLYRLYPALLLLLHPYVQTGLILFSLFFLALNTSAEEKFIKNITQLTFGGDNAEAYFSPDGKQLTFQTNNPAWGLQCDQIYRYHIDSGIQNKSYKPSLISTGKGRTTCSYFMPDGQHILYASTHLASDHCPHMNYIEGKYLWPVYDSYDIFVSDLQGNNVRQLTHSKGYDAEATVSPQGDKIVFTSDRSGDLELWTMNIDGSDQRQITFGLGYDGGAFFSPDGKKIVFRASRPQTDEEIIEYKKLLSQGLVSPSNMEIYVCDVDGSNLTQVTRLGKANWAPFFHPSGQKIIFSSNHHSQRGYDFQLYIINIDGTGLQQITTESKFNAFPMFSPDGKKLVFSSNRNNNGTRDTNLFIADWEE
jgi:Periplasmic component of the Tol biopolymer transport system